MNNREVLVRETHRGLLFRDGALVDMLGPGRYRLTTEVQVSYLAPARFDDRLTVLCACGELRGARFRFDYLVERNGERLAEGWSHHACVDAVTHRPTRVPAWLLEEIASAES